MRQHVLVAYDICEPGRLRNVHKTVLDFGDPLQYSVFACQLSATERASLEARLREIIDHDQDQVIFTTLGPVKSGEDGPPRCETLGRPIQVAVRPSLVY